jgi:hypothetical protein
VKTIEIMKNTKCIRVFAPKEGRQMGKMCNWGLNIACWVLFLKVSKAIG